MKLTTSDPVKFVCYKPSLTVKQNLEESASEPIKKSKNCTDEYNISVDVF